MGVSTDARLRDAFAAMACAVQLALARKPIRARDGNQ